MSDAKLTPPVTYYFDPAIVRELVRSSRAAQGLPDRITDPSVIARLAVLVNGR